MRFIAAVLKDPMTQEDSIKEVCALTYNNVPTVDVSACIMYAGVWGLWVLVYGGCGYWCMGAVGTGVWGLWVLVYGGCGYRCMGAVGTGVWQLFHSNKTSFSFPCCEGTTHVGIHLIWYCTCTHVHVHVASAMSCC